MKINDIDDFNWDTYFEDRQGSLAEILNNYDHPLFDVAFQMLEDKEFYIDKQSNKRPTTVDGGNR